MEIFDGRRSERADETGTRRRPDSGDKENVLFLHIADAGLFVFHTVLVVFNCVGWIWVRTRRWHLATLGATAASWLVLGIWFGPGYCLCTDLHWRVRAALGERVHESTYIQYLVARLTGWTPDAAVAANATAGVFLAVLTLSVWLNVRDARRQRGLKRAIQ